MGRYATLKKEFRFLEKIYEFEQRSGSPREQIHRAAEWLRSAIADKCIMV